MTGALMRMTARHGSSNAQRFATWIGIDLHRPTTPPDVFCIADACNLNRQELLRFTPLRIDKKKVRIGENQFFGGHHMRNRRRVCPDCLADDVDHAKNLKVDPDYICHLRVYWEIKQIWSCHRHHRALIDACPHCGADLIYKYGRPRWCQNGCDLAQHRDDPPLHAPFDAYLASRLGFGSSAKHAVLDRIDFYNLSAFVNRLGRWKLQLPAQQRGTSKELFTEMLEHREVGYRLLANFPESLEPIFDQTVKENQNNGKHGMLGNYGHFYNAWFGPWSDNVMLPLQEPLRAHALKNDIIMESEAVLGSEAGGAQYASISDVAKRMGMTHKACSRDLKRIGILPKNTRFGAHCRVLEKEAVEALRYHNKARLTLAETQKALGITYNVLQQFLEAGLLKADSGRITSKSYRFFLRRISKLCSTQKIPECALTIRQLSRKYYVSEAAVYKAILRSSSNCWYASDSCKKVGKILVVPQEEMVAAIPNRRLNLEQVKQIIGVQHKVLAPLFESQALQRAGKTLVWQSSVTRFDNMYISDYRAAKKIGLSRFEFAQLMEEERIKPKFPKSKFHQNIYQRSALDRLN